MWLRLFHLRLFRIFGCVLFLCHPIGLRAAPVEAEHTTIELISEMAAVAPGASFNVALRFVIEPHWHIYWKNPGSSGLPVEVEWDLPEGYEAGEIQWPAPERIELGGLVNYGYEDAVTLIVPIRASTDTSVEVGDVLKISGEAFWLICKEVCLPGDASLSLEIPIAESSRKGPEGAAFMEARMEHPKMGAPWSIRAEVDGSTLLIALEGNGVELPQELYFYAGSEGIVDPDAPQMYAIMADDTARLSLSLAEPFLREPLERIPGVFQAASGNWEVELDLKAQVTGDAQPDSSVRSVAPEAGGLLGFIMGLGLFGWLLLAFAGGFILNLMPCVLPVLSLKVFSLLKHSGQSRRQALLHGLAYTAGVVISFLVLAGFLIALRALGERVGWGFQLQSPNFVVALTGVFFLFALNLMGVFEVGTSLVGADTKVSQRNDTFGSFGMGILAAVVGAPCMGPLIAPVSGIAVQAHPAAGLLIFGTMGFGLAAPFLLLSLFPKLVAYLPKPGVWMESLKQFMGFLLMAAVLFLLYVVGGLGGISAIMGVLIGLLLLALAAWVYGRWSVPVKAKKVQRIAQLVSLVLVISGFIYGVRETQAAYDRLIAEPSDKKVAHDGDWSAWSRARVDAEIAAGNPVLIDFTATWCLICQVNKKVALRTEETNALLKRNGVVTLEADWTRYDPAITDELERFGRSGVPLYIYYNSDGEPIVLPQNLTNGILRAVVEGG